MIARTLSRIARCAANVLVAGISLGLAANIPAQDEIQVTAPSNVIENPFVSSVKHEQPQPRVVSPEPPASQRRPITYQNPFAAISKSPPVDSSLRPGPVSRWRRPNFRVDDVSPIKSALISSEAEVSERRSWEQLPPADVLRRDAACRQPETDPTFYSRLTALPSPIHLAPTPLTQPAWIAAEPNGTGRDELNRSHVDRAIFNAPLDAPGDVKPVAASSAPPNMPGHQAAVNAVALNSRRDLSTNANLSPTVVSNCVDSPVGWLDQAQHAAEKANSPEQLSTVIELCDRGLRGGPDPKLLSSLRRLDAWAHNRRGEIWADADRPDDALNDFQAAIALDPNCSLAIHNRAVSFAQQKNFAAALRDFNRVIELNPGLAVAYRNRAELLSALGRMEDAVADYTQAMEGLPNDVELYRGRAYAYQRLGQFSKARADYNRALEIAPSDPDALTQRGNLAAEQGDYDQALTDYRRALANDPNWCEAHRSLAWLEATCPNPRYQNSHEAITEAEAAAKLAPPGDYLVLDTLAAAYASGGQFDKAADLQRQALKYVPSESAAPLEQRLALYQHGQAYRDVSPSNRARARDVDANISQPDSNQSR